PPQLAPPSFSPSGRTGQGARPCPQALRVALQGPSDPSFEAALRWPAGYAENPSVAPSEKSSQFNGRTYLRHSLRQAGEGGNQRRGEVERRTQAASTSRRGR